jgi:hypothetical protein
VAQVVSEILTAAPEGPAADAVESAVRAAVVPAVVPAADAAVAAE